MRALLLAAGRGTRLGRLSETTPKCLQSIGGMPLLDRVIGQLQDVGVKKFLINVHHHAQQIEQHILDNYGIADFEIVQEEQLLGTLGTLRANSWFFQNDYGWVLHADNYIVGNLAQLLEDFKSRPPECTGAMLTFRTDDPTSCGIVERDSRGVLTSFHEKLLSPPGNEASAATFIFDSDVFAMMRELPPNETDLGQHLIPRLVGQLLVVSHDGDVVDIGTPLGLEKARRLAQQPQSISDQGPRA